MNRRLTQRLTIWGEALDADAPLPEYPRPQLVRASYLNLNGRWQFAVRGTTDEPVTYDREIVVPFPPEATLSGVGRVLQPDEVAHYRRGFALPPGFQQPGERVLLHFGGVDQWCRVSVNGRVVAEHSGGSLPFDCDITEALREGENLLQVAVTDPTDTGQLSRGKQVLKPGGIWYTPHSGIWQTVWLEAVPAAYVQRLVIVPDLPAGQLRVTVETAHPVECQVRVSAEGQCVASASGPAGTPLVLSIEQPRWWSPEDPFLYDLEVRAGADVVTSYAGMRSFGVGEDARGMPRLLLNGRPYLHVGVLDQGYWSDGLVTAPADEALVYDILTMKRLGFTMLRKHIKVEPLRWYYHCDRLGMLVWQDMVNGGGPYSRAVTQIPAVLPWRISDSRYAAFGRSDAAGREHWRAEMRATVEHLRNVVGLAVWVPFNEGWGQFDAAAATAELRALDQTRQIDHASGWHDQHAGDLRSLHIYFRPFRVPRRGRDRRVLALTEYGGYSQRLPDHSVSPTEFGYRRFATADDLARAFQHLHDKQLVPAVPRGLSASVYTQLSDVEDETNGLLTYDRRVLKVPEAVVTAVTTAMKAAL